MYWAIDNVENDANNINNDAKELDLQIDKIKQQH